jgi:alkyl hydroperoxide reductase subunit AhpC
MPSYEAQSAEFARRNAQVVGVSVDSVHSHRAWAKTFNGISTYPLLADFHPKGAVAQKYGVFREADGIAERAVIIIDKTGVVRYIDVHDIGEHPDNKQIFEELDKLNG